MNRRFILSAALLLAGAMLSPGLIAQQVDEIVVVVNKANAITTASRDDLRPLFQTTKNRWPDGNKATPLNLPEDATARKGFDAAVLGLDPERVAKYWIDRKIRGGERPPRTVSAASAMLRAVADDTSAVGYVMRSEVDASVKIVAKIRGGSVSAP